MAHQQAGLLRPLSWRSRTLGGCAPSERQRESPRQPAVDENPACKDIAPDQRMEAGNREIGFRYGQRQMNRMSARLCLDKRRRLRSLAWMSMRRCGADLPEQLLDLLLPF